MFVNTLTSRDPSNLHLLPKRTMETMANKDELRPLQVAVVQSGTIAIPFTRLLPKTKSGSSSETKPSSIFNKLNSVALPRTSSVIRDLKTAYELVKRNTDDIRTVSMVTFVAQKPKPEDLEMIKTLQGLGLKVTVITLGNDDGVDEWLGVDNAVPMPGGGKDSGKDSTTTDKIIDQVIEQVKKGFQFSFYVFITPHFLYS